MVRQLHVQHGHNEARENKISAIKSRTNARKKPQKKVIAAPESYSQNYFSKIYETKYLLLMLIPLLLLLGSITYLSLHYVQTGEVITKGISLKGGITYTINHDLDLDQVHQTLSELGYDYDVRTLKFENSYGVVIDLDAPVDHVDQITSTLESELHIEDYNVEQIGSSLGASFFSEIVRSIIFAFIFMGIVVFLYFRIPVPSFAIIIATISDIVVTMAIIDIIGLKLSSAGIAAFLMLIGYAVDTNILLSMRVLKEKEGTVLDRIYDAMQTGLTMTVTTVVAVIAALIFSPSEVLRQIMIIVLIGLVVDVINTWIQNAGMLRWYLERKSQ